MKHTWVGDLPPVTGGKTTTVQDFREYYPGDYYHPYTYTYPQLNSNKIEVTYDQRYRDGYRDGFKDGFAAAKDTK